MQELPNMIKGSNGQLRGIVHKPALGCKGVVIFLHGYFSSTKLGPVNLYVRISRILASVGYEVWRFDSYGVGDSDGEFFQSSYDTRLNDYAIITNEALKEHENLIYFGHSMGSTLAIQLA